MTKKKDPKDLLKVGRPEIIKGDILQKLEQAFMIGCTDEEACASVDIATSTLYAYQDRHPEFVERKRALKDKPMIKARYTIYQNMGDPKVAMWYAERKRKSEFSIKTEQEITGKAIAVQKVFVTQQDNDEANKIIDNLIGKKDE